MLKRQHKAKGGRMYTLLLLLVLAVFAMVFLYNSSHRRGANPFRDDFTPGTGDTLNVAIEMNPSVYRVKGDTVTGRDYEMLTRISRQCGVPLKLYPFVPLARAMAGLDDGTFDVVVASLPRTTELRDRCLMTDAVYLDREILVQLADSLHRPIKTQVELGGDTVWITQDSPFRSRLENLSDEIGDTIYIMSSPEYSAEALVILTSKGILKYAVVNEGIAKAMVHDFPNLDISTPISFTQFQSWAVSKDNPALLDSLNTWLSRVR